MSDSETGPNTQHPAPSAPGSSPEGSGPILAVDFGERRIGLAISDAERRLAMPLATIERDTDRRAVARIRDLARERSVALIVVGEPPRPPGRATEERSGTTRRAVRFAAKLGRATGLPWTLVDESLTTVEARRRMRHAGIDRDDGDGRIDRLAAQVILEQFLADLGGESRR